MDELPASKMRCQAEINIQVWSLIGVPRQSSAWLTWQALSFHATPSLSSSSRHALTSYISEMMALHEDKSLVCSQGRLAHNMYRERFQFATSYLVCFGQSPWLCRWTLLSHDRHLLFINPSAIKKKKNKNTNTHLCFTVIVRRITMDLYNDSLFFSPCNFLHFDPSIYLSSNLVL
jgi:hypothetical protein